MEKDTNNSFAMEVLEQAKRNTKMWFVTWILTMAALIGTNAYWIYIRLTVMITYHKMAKE